MFGKVEFPHSAFSSFIETQENNYVKEYQKALKNFKSGDYSAALNQALFVADNTNNFELKIASNKLIGEIFQNINNHKKAISYYKKTLSLIRSNKSNLDKESKNLLSQESELLLKIGGSYQLIPQIDSAQIYFQKILNLNSFDIDVRLKQADAHSNLSALFFYTQEIRDLKKAKYHANKAIEIHTDLNKNQTLAADYGNLASIYMEEGNMLEAKKLYKKGLEYIKDDNRLKAVKYREALYDNLGWTLYNLEDYVAYDYLDKSISIRDSLREQNLNKSIEELEIKYNKELAVMKAIEVEKQKTQRNYWLVGSLGLISILALGYFVNYYKLRQQTLQAELSQKELEQRKNIDKLKSEAQTKLLNATIDAKEFERKQIAETLHDNVSALLSSANMHIQASQKQFNGEAPEELEKTRQIIAQASQQIRDLSHSLVSSVLLKFGLGYAIKNSAEKFSNSEITFHTQVDGLSRYEQDFEIKIYNIIQEFINNILKHSKAETALIRIKEAENKLYISVEDDGVGFNPKKSLEGGIGLNQINARIKMMNGKFDVISAKNQGTKIKIIVPVVEKTKVSYV